MRKFSPIILFLLIQTLVFSLKAQNYHKIDSLIKLTVNQRNDSTKVSRLRELSQIYDKFDSDTAYIYIEQAINISDKLINEKKNDTLLLKQNAHLQQISGNIFLLQYNNSSALTSYKKALEISEIINNKAGIGKALNSCGLVMEQLRNYVAALDYYEKSNHIYNELNNLNGISASLNNIAGIYLEMNQISKALEHYMECLKINLKTGNKLSIATSYNNIGESYYLIKNYQQALNYYQKGNDIYQRNGDNIDKAIGLNNIANCYMQLGDYEGAIKNSYQSLKYAKQIGSYDDMKESYKTLCQCYEKMNDFKQALEFSKLYSGIKDTIFNSEQSKKIHEVEALYQNDKKKKEIELLNKDKLLQNLELTKQESEIRRQRFVIYAFIFFVLIVVTFSFLLFHEYSMKKKANNLLIIQNAEILQQKEEIISQRDNLEILNAELHQQKEEIVAQRDNLELLNAELQQQKEEVLAQRDEIERQKNAISEQHKNITNSIKYAKRIQTALLPENEYINKIFPENFVIFKPKNIVSGDFYIIKKINNFLIFAVADCTGHGVPGAFMSMLGIAVLNEIIRRRDITRADQVLNELRNQVIMSLHQTGKFGESKDGMDIAICVLDEQTLQMQFAAANSQVYILRKTENNEPPKFLELKGDRMPIGIGMNSNRPFTQQELDLSKGDAIYLLTDGYQDQFGGKDGQKFLAKNIRNLLTSIFNEPLENQREILEKTLTDWKGYLYSQVDDILVFGVRV